MQGVFAAIVLGACVAASAQAAFTEQDEALHHACREEDIDEVGRLLDLGAAINSRNPKQLDGTALMSAAAMNRTGIALLLISRGADINAQGKTKRSSMMWTSRWGHQNMARILLGAGVDLTLKDASKMTALDLAHSKGQLHVEKLIEENVAKKIRDLYQEKKPEDMHLIPQMMFDYRTPIVGWKTPSMREQLLFERLEYMFNMPGQTVDAASIAEAMKAPLEEQDKELAEIEAAYEREAAEAAATKEKEEAEKEAAFANTKEGKLKTITDEITELYKTCKPEKLEELPGKLEKYQNAEETFLKNLKMECAKLKQGKAAPKRTMSEEEKETLFNAARDNDAAALAKELGVMKKIELKKRARTAGITQDELDEAGEAEDEAAAVIELILAKMRQEGYKQDL